MCVSPRKIRNDCNELCEGLTGGTIDLRKSRNPVVIRFIIIIYVFVESIISKSFTIEDGEKCLYKRDSIFLDFVIKVRMLGFFILRLIF